MRMRAESSIPAMRDGWGMLRSANAYSTFRPEPLMGASADFCIACLWSALGLTLTGLLFAFGMGAEIGQILAMAG
jgi:hypothetical protein